LSSSEICFSRKPLASNMKEDVGQVRQLYMNIIGWNRGDRKHLVNRRVMRIDQQWNILQLHSHKDKLGNRIYNGCNVYRMIS
jgi:hypothetical protein